MLRRQESGNRLITSGIPCRMAQEVSGTGCQAQTKNSRKECRQGLLLPTLMLWDLPDGLYIRSHSPFIHSIHTDCTHAMHQVTHRVVGGQQGTKWMKQLRSEVFQRLNKEANV